MTTWPRISSSTVHTYRDNKPPVPHPFPTPIRHTHIYILVFLVIRAVVVRSPTTPRSPELFLRLRHHLQRRRKKRRLGKEGVRGRDRRSYKTQRSLLCDTLLPTWPHTERRSLSPCKSNQSSPSFFVPRPPPATAFPPSHPCPAIDPSFLPHWSNSLPPWHHKRPSVFPQDPPLSFLQMSASEVFETLLSTAADVGLRPADLLAHLNDILVFLGPSHSRLRFVFVVFL